MLFPNLTVAEQHGAGIGSEVPKASGSALISEELERFGLRGFGQRIRPSSPVARQLRVALARMLGGPHRASSCWTSLQRLDYHLKGVLEQNLVSLFDAFEGTILYVRTILTCRCVLRPHRGGGRRGASWRWIGGGSCVIGAVDGGAEAVRVARSALRILRCGEPSLQPRQLQPRHRLRPINTAPAPDPSPDAPGVIHHRDAVAKPQRLVNIVVSHTRSFPQKHRTGSRGSAREPLSVRCPGR